MPPFHPAPRLDPRMISSGLRFDPRMRKTGLRPRMHFDWVARRRNTLRERYSRAGGWERVSGAELLSKGCRLPTGRRLPMMGEANPASTRNLLRRTMLLRPGATHERIRVRLLPNKHSA